MPEETVVLENDISELEKLKKALDSFGAKNNLSQNTVIEINDRCKDNNKKRLQ